MTQDESRAKQAVGKQLVDGVHDKISRNLIKNLFVKCSKYLTLFDRLTK